MVRFDKKTMQIIFENDFFKDFARDKPCLVRIAPIVGMQCAPPDTTVLCHPSIAGLKATGSRAASVPDVGAAWGCRVCHDIIDGRITTDLHQDTIRLYHLEGVIRTIDALVKYNVLPNP